MTTGYINNIPKLKILNKLIEKITFNLIKVLTIIGIRYNIICVVRIGVNKYVQ